MPDININLDEALTKQMTVHENLSQEIIVTNTDKVKLILNDHHLIIKKKTEWIGPIGIFVTILTTILTAKFQNAFGLDAQNWQAIFTISCIFFFFWSVKLLYIVFNNRSKGTVDDFIEKLKLDPVSKTGL